MRDYKVIINNIFTLIKERYSHLISRKKEFVKAKKFLETNLSRIRNEKEFLDLVKKGLELMKDTHINIILDKEFYRTYEIKPEKNYNIDIARKYLKGWLHGEKEFISGLIDKDIGYLLIKSFHPRHEEEILKLLKKIPKTKNLIIDLRANSGGSSKYSVMFMNKFFEGKKWTMKRIAYYTQERKSILDEKSFTKLIPRILVTTKTDKKIILLIGKRTMSSGEIATLEFLTIPKAITIGDESQGNSGNPKVYNLETKKEIPFMKAINSRGLYITIPSWRLIMKDGRVLFGNGIIPDIKIQTKKSIVGRKDRVLEKAIETINK